MASHSKRMKVRGVDMNIVLWCAQPKKKDAFSVVNMTNEMSCECRCDLFL